MGGGWRDVGKRPGYHTQWRLMVRETRQTPSEFLTLARQMHHFAQRRVEVIILQHTAGILRRCGSSTNLPILHG